MLQEIHRTGNVRDFNPEDTSARKRNTDAFHIRVRSFGEKWLIVGDFREWEFA